MGDTLSDLAEAVLGATIAAGPSVCEKDIKAADLEKSYSFPVAKAIMLAVSLSAVVVSVIILAFAI